MRPVDSLLGALHALLAQPAGGGPAAPTQRATLDVASLAAAPSSHAFGCNCQKNPSGLSDSERAAAVAANMAALGLA